MNSNPNNYSPYKPGVHGKTVVITGGASGLGRASALAYARAGANVYVADVVREPREGGAPTAELIQQEGGTAAHVDTDVSKWEDIDNLISTAAADTGRVDVLMTSAVFLGTHSKDLLETEPEDWDAMMNVNLRGVFMCCRRAMQQMLPRSRERRFGANHHRGIPVRIRRFARSHHLLGMQGRGGQHDPGDRSRFRQAGCARKRDRSGERSRLGRCTSSWTSPTSTTEPHALPSLRTPIGDRRGGAVPGV